jgi:hypothetical protein
MARLVTSGFELQTMGLADATSAPDGGSSSAALETTIVRSGTAALNCVSAAMVDFGFTAVALGNDCFARSYVYVPTGSLPTTKAGILEVLAGVFHFTVALESNGTLTLWSNLTTQQGSASPAVTLDAWNMVDLRVRIGTGALDQVEGRLGGVSFASASGLNITDSQIATCRVGIGAGFNSGDGRVIHDDVAVNDSSGASQTSWPGDGKIVLLKPISDNARGTGWVNDANAASGFFDATDNTPPVGIAQTTASTGLHQIQNATSNANSNVDLNLTTYTTAGIAAADTVNVLVPVVATGAPVVTSAKAGTYGIASNPAITNIALGAGGTSGAFWSGVTGGTYPTGWKWSFGTTTYAPSVTVGTSPVARITQVTSSTRIAMVCAMGMYVDYTPATLPTGIPDVGMGLTVT